MHVRTLRSELDDDFNLAVWRHEVEERFLLFLLEVSELRRILAQPKELVLLLCGY